MSRAQPTCASGPLPAAVDASAGPSLSTVYTWASTLATLPAWPWHLPFLELLLFSFILLLETAQGPSLNGQGCHSLAAQ